MWTQPICYTYKEAQTAFPSLTEKHRCLFQMGVVTSVYTFKSTPKGRKNRNRITEGEEVDSRAMCKSLTHAALLTICTEAHQRHVMPIFAQCVPYLGKAGCKEGDWCPTLWGAFLLHSLLEGCPKWHRSIGWSPATGTRRLLLAQTNQLAVSQEAGERGQGRWLH